MRINQNESIRSARLLLVPYCSHHVPTYHKWMQNEDLQKLTASEPLTLAEEYTMQQSWRQDADKLTFIICMAPDASKPRTSGSKDDAKRCITPGKEDAPDRMIGDVNLFLYPDVDEEEQEGEEEEAADSVREEKEARKMHGRVVGEVEIMIARPDARGQGLAREALQSFLWYVAMSLPAILDEYTQDESKTGYIKYLRVKIDKDNTRSLGLFQKLGFAHVSGPNYFGEMELRSKLVQGQGANLDGTAAGLAEKLEYGTL